MPPDLKIQGILFYWYASACLSFCLFVQNLTKKQHFPVIPKLSKNGPLRGHGISQPHLVFSLCHAFRQFLFACSSMFKLCTECPVLEDTLMRLMVIGLSREMPLNPPEAVEFVDILVRRAANLYTEGNIIYCCPLSCVEMQYKLYSRNFLLRLILDNWKKVQMA